MEISLSYPIDFEGGKLEKLTLRRPQVKDVRRAKNSAKGDVDQELKLVSDLSGLPPSAIEELDVEDYAKVQDALAGFFGSKDQTV